MKKSIFLLLAIISFSCSEESKKLFIQVDAKHSNVHFSNNVVENEKYNVYDYHNLYNGGGIAAFDANNDGLIDLYFTGNQVHDKLYLNKGNFVFEDITQQAGIIQKGWSTGVTITDVNGDGLLDLYVSKAGNESEENLKNLLYVNQGNLTFKEEAEERAIADTSLSTQAAFFDYDKDGDLDLYILTTSNLIRNPNLLGKKDQYGNYALDKLYKNDGTGHFEEVGLESGINANNHGLGLAIADINGDGWQDILASSDFLPNDALYINNQDGTFTNKAGDYLPYQSRFSMGNDIADINNDGLLDMVTVDMLPADNGQQKKMLMTSYHVFETEQTLGYQKEFTRNMLFQNAGNDAKGETYFNEIGQFSGIHATDWSWAPLILDFDNDGLKDLYISNGYLRDVTNSDNISYNMSFAQKTESAAEMRDFMNQNALNSPKLQRKNQFFKNENDFNFSNQKEQWINQTEGFSNGAIFADLDNDGDLDYVVNNINETAHIFRNESTNNFVAISFKNNKESLLSEGATIKAYSKGVCQTYTNTITRGYLSSMLTPINIGLGKGKKLDSLRIIWPNNQSQFFENITANQTIISDLSKAKPFSRVTKPQTALFTETVFDYKHTESRYIDFYRENLLLKKYSQHGPVLASRDIDNDNLDDVFIGGNTETPSFIFKQTPEGGFSKTVLHKNQTWEDAAALFLDINNDGYLDLYTASGSNEFPLNSGSYQDHFYLNKAGKGFQTTDILPKGEYPAAAACLIDIDNDGHKDIFRAGGVLPGSFPDVGDSYFLKNVNTQFQKIEMGSLGLVTEAKAFDFNKDGWEDLIIVGEYMAPTLFINQKGKLVKSDILGNRKGLWNSIQIADLDNDGFQDLVLGNKGVNFRYPFNKENPLEYHELNLTETGKTEKIQTYFQNGNRVIIPARDELIREYPYLRSLFPDYNSYAIFNPTGLTPENTKLSASFMKSVILWNKGGNKVETQELPKEAQQFAIKSILITDIYKDGKKDLLLAGNDFEAEPINSGYTEGSKSCLLLNKGQRNFQYISNNQSGIWLKGSVSNMLLLKTKNSSQILAAINNENMKVFIPNKKTDSL